MGARTKVSPAATPLKKSKKGHRSEAGPVAAYCHGDIRVRDLLVGSTVAISDWGERRGSADSPSLDFCGLDRVQPT